jgi:hypothetical protein
MSYEFSFSLVAMVYGCIMHVAFLWGKRGDIIDWTIHYYRKGKTQCTVQMTVISVMKRTSILSIHIMLIVFITS